MWFWMAVGFLLGLFCGVALLCALQIGRVNARLRERGQKDD